MPVLEGESAATAGESINLQGRSYGLQTSLVFSLFAIWDQRYQAVSIFFSAFRYLVGKGTAGSAYLNATEHV